MIHVSDAFDAGAVEVVAIEGSSDAVRADLRIRRDSHADFSQWFRFRISGVRGRALTLRFVNASESTYAEGWNGYRAVASCDREAWFRVPTEYSDGALVIRCTAEADTMDFAYFEPYGWDRHLALIGRMQRSPRVRAVRLGTTPDGRDFDALVLHSSTGAKTKRPMWVIARQHPGETMAEWFVEGMLERLVDEADPVSRALLERADLYVVPNMNPDGSVRGNLRTNAKGANLNREWLEPSMERSPEVALVREWMISIGVDLFVDVHGDEVLPYNFVAGSEMLPDFTASQAEAQRRFVAAFKAASPDFQDRFGYPAGRYSTDALKLASKWVGHRFGCLSLTLEMPFKDNADWPDERVGWNGARSKRLGAAMLLPMLAHV